METLPFIVVIPHAFYIKDSKKARKIQAHSQIFLIFQGVWE